MPQMKKMPIIEVAGGKGPALVSKAALIAAGYRPVPSTKEMIKLEISATQTEEIIKLKEEVESLRKRVNWLEDKGLNRSKFTVRKGEPTTW